MNKRYIEEKDGLTVLVCAEIMEIGGAETHVFELSKKLIEKGFRVIIMSQGGVFADMLEKLGAIKITVPWRTKNIKKLASSFFKAVKVIKEYSPAIVHSHARMPSLIMHYACRVTRTPFVTTDHAKFENPGFLSRFLSRWGDKTIVISDDLKKYLLENYKNVREENIFATINGIDTDRFSSRRDDAEFKKEVFKEFGLRENQKLILSVSRLDDTAYLCVYELLSVAAKLYAEYPDSRLVIVGSGNIFDDVKRRAKEINSKLGTEYVILAGARSDTERLCGVCDVFVGCARSALEAISCASPTIIAGNGGYLGLLCENNVGFCKQSNFTSRGIDTFPPETLAKDILSVLKNEAGTHDFCEKGRDLIISEFSAQKMADDCTDVYYRAIRGCEYSFDAVITGYYGHGNSGDDALLLSIIRNLRLALPHIRICVLCRINDELRAELKKRDVFFKDRFNLFSVFSAFSKSHTLIFGGGSLLQDNTSTKSLLYYISLLKLARLFGMKTMLYGNGIGPLLREKNAKRVKNEIGKIDSVTLRDEDSMKLLLKIGADTSKCLLASDEVLTSVLPTKDGTQKVLEKYWLSGIRYAVISVRDWKKAPDAFYDSFREALVDFCEKDGLVPVFIVMEREHDEKISTAFSDSFSQSHVVFADCDPYEMIALCACASIVVSMRLHALIYASLSSVPIVALSYDPKVESFMSQIGAHEYSLDLDGFDKDAFEKALSSASENGIEERIADNIEALKERAKTNLCEAIKLLTRQ